MMVKIQLSPQELITFYNLLKYKSDILNSNNFLLYFDHIYAALVSRRDFFQKHSNTGHKLLKGCIYWHFKRHLRSNNIVVTSFLIDFCSGTWIE